MTEGSPSSNMTDLLPDANDLRARVEAFLASGAGDSAARALLGEVLSQLDHTRPSIAESTLHHLFGESTTAYVLLDERARIARANPAAAKLLGEGIGESRGLLFSSLLSDESRPMFETCVRAVLRRGVPFRNEFQRANSSLGTQLGIEGRSISASRGGEAACLLSVTEITDPISTADQLRIRESRFRRVIENASDGIALVTPAGEVLDLSAAAERILGTTLARLRADPSITDVHPEDKARVFRAFMKSVSTGNRVGPIRYRCLRGTGEWIWLETVCTNLLSDPEVRALVLNFRDIHEQVLKEDILRESRAFLEKAQQVASIGSWKADPFSMEETLIWSPETYRIFGLDPEQGAINGHKFFEMVHPEDRDRVRKASTDALHHDKPHSIDLRIILPDGRVRWVNEQAEIMRDASGTPIMMVGVVQDITDRKQAQADLERSESRFRLAAECASDCIYELDVSTRAVEIFGDIDSLLGYEPGGFPRDIDGWLGLVHPDDIGNLRESYARHLLTREPFSIDYRIFSKSGEIHYWTGRAQTMWDDEGNPVRTIGAITDITRRMKAENAIRESESRFRRLVESNIIGAVFSAIDGSIWDANDAFLKMIGFTRAELEAGEVGWLNLTPPEFAPLDERAIGQLMARGSCDVYEKEFFRKDGSRVPVLLAVSVLDLKAGTAVSIVLDITERKAATEALRKMNMELEQKVEARTAELRTQSDRRAALAELELAINTPGELQGVLGQIVEATSRLLPASAGCSVVLWDAENEEYTFSASTTGRLEYPLNEAVRRTGGITRRIIDTRAPYTVPDVLMGPDAADRNPILDARGVRSYIGVPMLLGDKMLGVMYAMELEPRDFTHEDIEFVQAMAQRAALAVSKVRLSEELREANAVAEAARIEADRANKAKSEFLSRMSHELRTPLNAVLGFAQILEMQPLDPEDIKCVNHISLAGAHLLNLINEVLDIARIESGRMSVSPEAIRIKEVLRQSLELVRPQLENRKVEIHWETGACDDIWVSADPSRLRQVFLNLLSNAIKYNRVGGSISLRCEKLDSEKLRLTFEDTGIGIPPNKIERIFTPFDRLGQESSGIEGSGLGLALSKRLVDVMRGDLSVESEPGKGTKVMLDLRLALPPGAGGENQSGRFSEEPAPQMEKSATLLYIEDNPANLELVQKILSSFKSIELLTAPNATTGLEIALQRDLDVIILDLHLPDMSGIGVLNRLRSNQKTCNIPVIVVSADASSGQQERLKEAGASEYMTKPIKVQHFLSILKSHLQD